MFVALPAPHTHSNFSHQEAFFGLGNGPEQPQDQEERVHCLGLGILLRILNGIQRDIDGQLDEAFGRGPMWLW